ncbi:MAG: RNA methyltransferase [Chloroflexi bacterium]|nr:RNA methyltransferase [Chloroflexota bacterium]MBI3168330.1 RNA methyltransferase [Chloroflexota bacterium]
MPKLTISVENAEFQIIQSLKLNRAKRHKAQEVFVEGIESIKQAVSAGLEITRIITPDLDKLSGWSKDLIRSNPKAKMIEMSFDLYKSLCDRDEPSEIVITAKVDFLSMDDLQLPSKPFVLIFDRPSDMGNLGSLIRSANSFGVDAILIIGHGVDVYDPKVIRSSLGSIFHSRIVNVQSMPEFETWIANQRNTNQLSVVGTDSTGDVSLISHKLARPIAVVLGNEAKGMSVALKELCDYVVSIPVVGAVNSLNVASAGSIILWDVYKNSQ